jgi:hypothetical protein
MADKLKENMSSLSTATSRDLKGLPRNTKTAAAAPKTPVNSTEPAASGTPNHSSDKSFSAPPAKNRTFTYFGGITEGHYTEF